MKLPEFLSSRWQAARVASARGPLTLPALLTLPTLLTLLTLSMAGCDCRGGASFKPIDSAAAVFWDRQTTESAELLRALVEQFNAGRTGALPIKLEYLGGYTDIFRKVSASIQAKTLPSMAVGYQSMTAEYVQAGAVAPLDTFIKDRKGGLTESDLADFFPVAIETNKYPEFGDKMYSFPFCKSVPMLYFNKAVLGKAGIAQPPKTWDEFLTQCRKVKEATGDAAYAISVDCSTVTAMIFSRGGEVVSGKAPLFDSPQTIKTFELLATLMREETAYQISPGTYDDEAAFAQDQVAFIIRSSSGRTSVKTLMKGNLDRWGMAVIPQEDPANPRTVLFGPNINVFNTTPEQQHAAWEFVKFFTSPDISVKWALGTGYLPIRKSAANNPLMQRFWAEWEYNRAAFDCLPYARTEPNLAGWQEVRSLVEKTEAEVLSLLKSPPEAAQELQREAGAVLARS